MCIQIRIMITVLVIFNALISPELSEKQIKYFDHLGCEMYMQSFVSLLSVAFVLVFESNCFICCCIFFIAIVMILIHIYVNIIIMIFLFLKIPLKYFKNSNQAREASELRFDGAESDTSHKFQ